MSSSSSETKESLSSGFDDMTVMYKRFLKFIGILPIEFRHFTYLPTLVLLIDIFAWSSIYSSMYVFYTIEAFRKKALLTETICELVLVLGVTLRYYLLARRRLEFAQLLDESRAIWDLCDENGHSEVRQFERKIRLVFLLLFASSSFTNVMYTVNAVVMTINAAHRNDSETQYLPFKWYSEEGPNLWPGYKMIFAIQVLVIQNACVIGTSVDTAGPLLIMIGAGYFRALQNRLSLVVEDDVTELLACSRLHQRILNFCSRIDRITSKIFLVQLMCTVYNLSLLAYKLAGSDPDRIKYVPLTLAMLGQLFICQWAPDHLIDESAAVSTATYFMSAAWMKRRLGKLLVLMMIRSQRPVQLTAAGFVKLSLETFRTMITSAMSFFTVLSNYTD